MDKLLVDYLTPKTKITCRLYLPVQSHKPYVLDGQSFSGIVDASYGYVSCLFIREESSHVYNNFLSFHIMKTQFAIINRIQLKLHLYTMYFLASHNNG